MNIFNLDHWYEIYHALSKNKTRTFITMIGVSWGMFLFVWLLGLVTGMKNGFNRDLAGTSTNSMFLWPGKTSIPYAGFGRGRTFDFITEDIQALRKNFPEIHIIAPRSLKESLVKFNTEKGNYRIFGDFAEQNKMFKNKIIFGRALNDDDIKNQTKVCVIGQDVVDQLYSKGLNPIGTRIIINNVNFNVIGIYEKSDKNFERGNSILIPFTTFSKMYNYGNKVGFMAINIKDNYDIKKTENKIKDFLKQKHSIDINDTQAIGSFNLGEMFGKLFGFLKGLDLLTFVVGFLTLFAGSIAVSSILLITVKERTKEFGIRRALGAKPIQILTQILFESAVITFLAGLIGIILGTIVLFFINNYVDKNPDLEIPLVNSSVDLTILISAFIVILFMAILAGLIPAFRAITIKPIDALREE